MIKNTNQLIDWFSDEKYKEIARAKAPEEAMRIFKECTYFQTLPGHKEYSRIGTGGMLYKLRHSPGVNVYVPGYEDVVIGYHPETQCRIPYPFVFMSERNLDLRMLIFPNAGMLQNFLRDIRNTRVNFDSTMATYLSEGVMKSVRLVRQPDGMYIPRKSVDDAYVSELKVDNNGEILRELFSQFTIASEFSILTVWEVVTTGQYGVYFATRAIPLEHNAYVEDCYYDFITKLAKKEEQNETN